jgi:mRNA interferase MazF
MPSTTPYKRGDIVLVPFPFTDLTSSKRRPALVISPDSFNAQQQDLVVAAITSQVPDITDSLVLTSQDFSSGTLPKISLVKPNKLFTIHSTLVINRVAVLKDEKIEEVLKALRLLFS